MPEQPAPSCRWPDFWFKTKGHIWLSHVTFVVEMKEQDVDKKLNKIIIFTAGWQYRWFVLDDSAGLFSYYTSKEKMMRGVRRGCVRLSGAILGIDDEVSAEEETSHLHAYCVHRNVGVQT
jgi:hypothetical protein